MGIGSVICKDGFDKFPELKSERLILRRITKEDAINMFEIYSDPETARFDWYYPIESVDKISKIIDNFQEIYDEKDEITWGAVKKDDNKLIGYCCLGDFQEGPRSCEIGYGFNREYWNKGYGTEAVNVLVKYAFEEMNINRIVGTVTLGNEASIKVLKKVGFQQEGIFRKRTFMKGEFVDDVILAILMEDYKEIKGEVNLLSEDIRIKETSLDDLENVARLWNDGEVMFYVGFPEGLGTNAEKLEKWLKWAVSKPNRCHYSVYADGIGYCGETFYEVDEKYKLSALDIKLFKESRGKGIAYKALSFAIEQAFNEGGAEVVYVDPVLENKKAWALYEKLGFESKPRPEYLEEGNTYLELTKEQWLKK